MVSHPASVKGYIWQSRVLALTSRYLNEFARFLLQKWPRSAKQMPVQHDIDLNRNSAQSSRNFISQDDNEIIPSKKQII